VDQPADELPGVALDDVALPRGEDDRALVLPSRAHLREERGPVLGARGHGDAALDTVAPNGRAHDREREDHRRRALFGDIWIAAVESDAQLEGPSGVGDVPVSEVHAKQVGVGARIGGPHHEQMFRLAADGIAGDER